jgi:EAL domain-containing protein (putative c-di-GMP-specific phosphodiesterase class I)
LAVVAEGVEHESQIEQLRELGCDAAQGYAIGRPVSEEQLEAAVIGGLTPAV